MITDAQIIECVSELGYPPEASSVRCPKCSYGPGWQCRNSRGTPMRRPHVARERAAEKAFALYVASCEALLNERKGVLE